MYEDTDGKIYLGGFNGGLMIFDPKTESFDRFLPDGGDNSISYHDVRKIIKGNFNFILYCYKIMED
ncbi:MAG: hypothetical protein HC906_10895 [Bacteroidales bacterium]|nr:hypothetical protein [Bacteroidales bacterium]